MKMGEARMGIRALPPAPNAGSRAVVPSKLNKRGTRVPASPPAQVKLAPQEALGENRHVPRGPRRGCVLPPASSRVRSRAPGLPAPPGATI